MPLSAARSPKRTKTEHRWIPIFSMALLSQPCQASNDFHSRKIFSVQDFVKDRKAICKNKRLQFFAMESKQPSKAKSLFSDAAQVASKRTRKFFTFQQVVTELKKDSQKTEVRKVCLLHLISLRKKKTRYTSKGSVQETSSVKKRDFR